jgi:hypothetical protein
LELPRLRGLDGSNRDERITQAIGCAHQQVLASTTDAIIVVAGVEPSRIVIGQISHRLCQLDQKEIVVRRVYEQRRGINRFPLIDVKHPYAVISARQATRARVFGLPTARGATRRTQQRKNEQRVS